MKNFVKANKLVAIILATTMASVFFTGCSQANDNREEESSKESIVVNLVEDSEESSEEEASVEESVVESKVVSVESSEELRLSNGENSVKNSERTTSANSESKTITIAYPKEASFDQITRYGKITVELKLQIIGSDIVIFYTKGDLVPIISINFLATFQ